MNGDAGPAPVLAMVTAALSPETGASPSAPLRTRVSSDEAMPCNADRTCPSADMRASSAVARVVSGVVLAVRSAATS